MALPTAAWGRTHGRSAGRSADPATSDPGYAFALAAADHFLQAWQNGDVENGMVLVGDSVRHAQSADKLEQFFSNATDRAFEITRGHGRPGRYSFPVVLVTPLVTRRGSHVARRFSEITLSDAGKNDWVVDKLP
ncbi:MAG: hypothetical protein WBW01_07735 [Terriglobales bacterium]